MQHAIRLQLAVKLQEDPTYYKTISEKFEAVLQELKDRWDEQIAAMDAILATMTQGNPSYSVEGIDAKVHGPFFGILRTEVERVSGSSLDQDAAILQRVVDLTRKVVEHIQQEIRTVDFWQDSIPAIKAAVVRPDGLAFTRERIRNAYLGAWGYEFHQYQSEKAIAQQEIRRLEADANRVRQALSGMPEGKTVSVSTVPVGATRWGWWGLATALILLNIFAVLNTAGYFRFQTQSWFLAILMAAPLLFVSLAIKPVFQKLPEGARHRAGWAMAVVGIMAFIVFIISVAVRAIPPGIDQVLDGAQVRSNAWIGWQLAAQILLEVVVAAALWWWLLELMISPAIIIANPDYDRLNIRLAAINLAMEPYRQRLSRAEGSLLEHASSLQFWTKSAEGIFLAYQEEENRCQARVAALDLWPDA